MVDLIKRGDKYFYVCSDGEIETTLEKISERYLITNKTTHLSERALHQLDYSSISIKDIPKDFNNIIGIDLKIYDLKHLFNKALSKSNTSEEYEKVISALKVLLSQIKEEVNNPLKKKQKDNNKYFSYKLKTLLEEYKAQKKAIQKSKKNNLKDDTNKLSKPKTNLLKKSKTNKATVRLEDFLTDPKYTNFIHEVQNEFKNEKGKSIACLIHILVHNGIVEILAHSKDGKDRKSFIEQINPSADRQGPSFYLNIDNKLKINQFEKDSYYISVKEKVEKIKEKHD